MAAAAVVRPTTTSAEAVEASARSLVHHRICVEAIRHPAVVHQ
jgi:hypothetical protein